MFGMSMASLLPAQPQPQATLPVCVCGACVICETNEWNKVGTRRVAHVRHADAEEAVGCFPWERVGYWLWGGRLSAEERRAFVQTCSL